MRAVWKNGKKEPKRGKDPTKYRALVARGIYMGQDRSDVGFAVKKLSTKTSGPREGEMTSLKRFGRYLIGRERMIAGFRYQGEVNETTIWTDSDYAGCKETRKSTSGGLVMIGNYVIKTWRSINHAVVALSSGEAEYYGIVKGASVAIGIRTMYRELGIEKRIRISADASAAKGIASRRGLGRSGI